MGSFTKAMQRSALVAVTAACAALLCGVCGCSQSASSEGDGIAARYDGGVVTEDEVTSYTADYRSLRGYDTDEIWAQHLIDHGLTVKTWREQVIGSLIEDRLLDARASELGMVADDNQVDAQIAADCEAAGIDPSDDESWATYLADLGTTPEDYRASIEKASVQYQLLTRELALDAVEDEAVLDSYIADNLISRVVRRYAVLGFDSREAAEGALAELSALSGQALADAFASWLDRDDDEATAAENGGDAGWDIANDWGSVQAALNDEMLGADALSAQVHELDNRFYLFLCTDRFEFDEGADYGDLPDDLLRDYVRTAALYAQWDALVSEYIAGLREAAHVQVREMPEGLPYDVDEIIADAASNAASGTADPAASGAASGTASGTADKE